MGIPSSNYVSNSWFKLNIQLQAPLSSIWIRLPLRGCLIPFIALHWIEPRLLSLCSRFNGCVGSHEHPGAPSIFLYLGLIVITYHTKNYCCHQVSFWFPKIKSIFSFQSYNFIQVLHQVVTVKTWRKLKTFNLKLLQIRQMRWLRGQRHNIQSTTKLILVSVIPTCQTI